MNKKIPTMLLLATIVSFGLLLSCSCNEIWQPRTYILTEPDSLVYGHLFMVYPKGVCLFKLEDKYRNEYTLYMKPKRATIKNEYKLIHVGDTINITLKINKKYPKYEGYFFREDFGKGITVQERLGVIYTSSDVINIRGRLYLKK
jgi:hypothetical protein